MQTCKSFLALTTGRTDTMAMISFERAVLTVLAVPIVLTVLAYLVDNFLNDEEEVVAADLGHFSSDQGFDPFLIGRIGHLWERISQPMKTDWYKPSLKIGANQPSGLGNLSLLTRGRSTQA